MSRVRLRQSSTTPTLSDRRRLEFYAAVFDVPAVVTDTMPGVEGKARYTEVVLAGAFSESLAGNREVLANVDHDASRTFARRSDGSLLLQEDPHGLYCSCWLPEDELGDYVLRSVKEGRMTGCSFRFTPVRERWLDGPRCELQAVDLADVCVTAMPAYPDTEVHVRHDTRKHTDLAVSLFRLAKIRMRKD